MAKKESSFLYIQLIDITGLIVLTGYTFDATHDIISNVTLYNLSVFKHDEITQQEVFMSFNYYCRKIKRSST